MNARFPYGDPTPESHGTTSGHAVSPWLEERLFDRRIVMLSGQLTSTNANNVAAALLTLDALSTEPVALHVTSPEGELAAAFAVVDAIDAMRAPVHAVVPGMTGGAAVLVLTAAAKRLAYRHARIRLTEPRATTLSGNADQITAAAGEHLRELDELIVRLAEVTGQARSRIENDLASGRFLSAAEAKEYGLVNEIVGKAGDDLPGGP
jgi:ATP-dependent Clp protease, protease subunit